MNKEKITDEMIERAQIGYSRRPDGSFRTPYPNADDVRRMLEAALSPDPEIPVSEGMIAAGDDLLTQITCCFPEEIIERYVGELDESEIVAAIYRAMESARRKEAQRSPEWVTTKTEEISPGVTRITGYYK